MNFDVNARTILKVKHGSHAYGLAVETSDLDVKGICIEPLEYHYGFAKNFEQHIQEASKGHEHDLVIYSLKKFAKLASASNPNVTDVLFVEDVDILECNSFGKELLTFRENFLSLRTMPAYIGVARSSLNELRKNYFADRPKALKHGMRAIMYLRRCCELLESGKMIVKRPDRENLLNIRLGGVSYETLLEEAESLQDECQALYETSTILPKSPDINKIDAFVVDLTRRYLEKEV